MRKILVVFILSLFIVVGCSKNEANLSSLSEQDRRFVWHQTRDKGFGHYDYPEIKEAEAEKLLSEKFQLQLPDFFKDIQSVVEKELTEEKIAAIEPFIQMYIQPTQVTYTKIIPFEKKKQPYLAAKFELKYQFDDGKKQVKLMSQTVMLLNQTEETSVLAEKIPLFSKDLGNQLSLEGVEAGVNKYEEQVSEAKGEIKNQVISIIDNVQEARKEKQLMKSIQLSYDFKGILREVYANITDLTE